MMGRKIQYFHRVQIVKEVMAVCQSESHFIEYRKDYPV
jgi:hypothetical protein